MTSAAPAPLATAEELVGRLLESAVGALDIFSIYAGEKLGWYQALAEHGPATASELAARTSTHERYVREWLEQQATTGLLAVEETAGAPARRFSLPEQYASVLIDRQSDLFLAPMGRFLVSAIGQAPSLLEAYRRGGGVSWEQYGSDMLTAQSDFNRPFFENSLAEDYLANVPGLDASLRAPGARVAEIGPGGGWAAIAIARVYPTAHVDAFEIDKASVELARSNVQEAGVAERVTIHQRDAGEPAVRGEYDLVCAFECIHDVPHPVSVLATMRRLVREGGTVLVMDERVGDEFGAVGDLVERLFYGFSLAVCLPDGMSHSGSAGTGTVMRPGTFRGYAQAAGFSDVEILPLEHDLFRFYRLVV
jgi:SAM-dependent methyltransferase